MGKRAGSKSFKRFLLSYVAVLMVPLMIGAYAYDQTVTVIEEDAMNANLNVLNQSKSTLDIRLKEIEQLAMDLALDPKVIHLANVDPPFTDREYYQIHEVLTDVKRYSLNQFVTDYFLHFPKSELLITRRSMYELASDYGVFFRYGELDYGQWLERFAFDGRLYRYFGAANIMYGGLHEGMITYQRAIMPGYTREAKGSVLITFPEAEIRKMFEHLMLEEGGWAYILDDRGEVVFSDAPAGLRLPTPGTAFADGSGYYYDEFDRRKMFVSYTTSPYNNWTYVAATPADTLLARANYIKRITWAVTSISLLVGLIFALVLASRNSKPIREILDAVKDLASGDAPIKGNDYDIIKRTVKQLANRHHLLQTSYDKHMPLIQSAFYERLFRGEFNNRSELNALSEQSGIALDGRGHLVLLMRFTDYDGLISGEIIEEIQRNKALVKAVLSRVNEHRALVYDAKADMFAVLLEIAELAEIDTIRARLAPSLSQLQDSLILDAGVSVAIGVGGVYADPLDAWKSYNEARDALAYGGRAGRKVYWHADLPVESNMYYYPLDLETRVMNLIRIGNREGLQHIIQHIEDANFRKRGLTDSVLRQLMHEMHGTLVKSAESLQGCRLPEDERLSPPDANRTPAEQFAHLRRQFDGLCAAVEKEKIDHNEHLIDQMIRYIESEYTSYHIGLASMASHFQLSESYTSTFFKEHTGENFSAYLETVRMKEAMRQLTDTNRSIVEIAESIGYGSDKAFRRAFKRYTGVLPTDYRRGKETADKLARQSQTVQGG